MQTFSARLAEELSSQSQDIAVGNRRYRAAWHGSEGWVVESGPEGEIRYRIEYALGGKNVFYFLTTLQKVLQSDPRSAPAAHNLGILVAEQDPEAGIALCRRAFELRPGGKYGFTLAFYLKRKGDVDGAITILRETIDREPSYPDAYQLLAELYSSQGRYNEASAVLRALQRTGKK